MSDERLRSTALELHILMVILAKVARQAIHQRLEAHDATLSGLQFGLMKMLAHEGDHTISELSRKFVLDPSTLVPVVDGLERKGLVIRGRDPNDRRRTPLSLTEEGKMLIHEVALLGDDDPLMTGLQHMGQDASEQLLSLMRDLVQHLPDGEAMLQGVQSRINSHRSH